MDKKAIKKFIFETIQEQNSAVDVVSIASHAHKGSDSVQILSSDIDTTNGFIFDPSNGISSSLTFYGVQSNVPSESMGVTLFAVDDTFNIQPIRISNERLRILGYKNIDITASGTTTGDNLLLSFGNAPQISILDLDATASLLSFTTGVGTNNSVVKLTSGDFNVRVDDGTNASNIELTPGKFELSATASFAVQLPNSNSLPSPVEGMIAYDHSNAEFVGCEVTGTWRKFVTAPYP